MSKRTCFLLCLMLALSRTGLCSQFEDLIFSGNKFVQEKKYKEAAREYKAAVELDPQSADANLLLGLTLANTGDLEGALSHTQTSIGIKPSYSGYYNLGLIQANEGRYAESAKAYEEALKINPSSYNAWHQLGLVYSTALQFDKAIEAYKKVIELNPQFGPAYQGLASASFWNLDTETATAQVQRLRELKMDAEAKALESWIKDKIAKKAKAAKKAQPATPAPAPPAA